MYKNLLQTNVLLVKQNSDLTCEINCLNKQNYDLNCQLREFKILFGKPEFVPLPELHIKEFNNLIDDLHETFEYDTDDEFIEEFKPQPEPQPEPIEQIQEPIEQIQEPIEQIEEPQQEPQPVQRVLKISQIPCLKCGLNYNCLRCKRKLM
jgi:hypothetical protein